MYSLNVTVNYRDGREEDREYKSAYDADDLTGIIKTYLENSDATSSFVFVVSKKYDDTPEHKVEGTQANFDRYIAGDR